MTMLAVIVVPFTALVVAAVFIRPSLLNVCLFLGGWVITGLGVTVGYHRYFTHGGFQASAPVEIGLGIGGHMSFMGRIDEWVAKHLAHHEHSDTERDLHSPHAYGDKSPGFLGGFFHAHVGWMLRRRITNEADYLPPRVENNRRIKAIDSLMPVWLTLSVAIPPAIGGLATHSWYGAWTAFLWGSLVRICFVHHVTWSVNSICHMSGSRSFETEDLSRNNFLFGLMALGEGWHNNHHKFPRSPRHGLLWWQIDPSWYVIRSLETLRLVRNASAAVPTEKRIQQALAE